MRTTLAMLLGAGVLLVITGVQSWRSFGSGSENETELLSDYLVDTEFLKQCARNHPRAVERAIVISPEIRAAVLHSVEGSRDRSE